MSNTQVNAEVLNDLIQINNDRIEGYQKAMEDLNAEDADLKSLFAEMVRESNIHKSALVQEVSALGHTPDQGTTASGKIYRAWMDVKAIFTGNDRKTVLNNCEYGEDAAQNAYKMALDTDGLALPLRDLISSQKMQLKASHDQIKVLRDTTPS